MSEGKDLKFKFVVDEQSAQRVNRVLDEMIKRAQDLAKTLQGVGVGGGGGGLFGGGSVGGRAPSAQSTFAGKGTSTTQTKIGVLALENAQAFKSMAGVSKDAMQVMSDAIKRGIGDQQRDLKGLDKTIADLSRRYQELGTAQAKSISQGMKAGQVQSLYGGEMERVQAQMLEAVGGRPKIQQEGDRLQRLQQGHAAQMGGYAGYGSLDEAEETDRKAAGLGGGLGGGGKGFGGRLRNMFGKLKPSGIGSVMSGIAGAVAVGNFGLDETLAGDRGYSGAEARRGSMVEGKIRSMHAGDTKFLFNAMMAQQDAEQRRNLAAQTGSTASTLEQVRGGVGQFVGSMPLIGGVGRALGLVGPDTGGGALGGFSTATQQSNKAENAFKMMDEQSKGTARLYMNMAQESFQGRMGNSLQLQRVMGVTGLQRDSRTGQYTNRAGDIQTQLEGQGLDSGQLLGSYQSLRGQAGSHFAGTSAYTAMQAQAQGYGGFDSVLAASARMGQRKQLALGAIGGGIDKAAGIQLGQGILGTGYDPRGTTGGYGTMAAVQSGMGFTGAASDFNKAQAAIGGLNYGSTITQGGIDSYQQGRNLVGAIGINPNGGSYSQDYLANGMSMKQMLDMANGGKMTQTAKALGLTPDMIKSQLSESTGSVFDRFVDEGKDNPMSKAIRGYQKSGMGYGDYLKKLKSEGDTDTIKTLGASGALLTGGNEEEGVAAAQIGSILAYSWRRDCQYASKPK